MRERALWALVVVASIALLISPALWNGFPLLQWDTGGYLARTYEGTLVPSRAVAYGLILRAGVPFAFWPVLIVQSALTVWIVALMLRVHGFGRRPLLVLGVITALTVLTTLPWLTAILLTDIFCVLGVIALYLLLLRADRISGRERIALIALMALSVATHSATFAVLVALTAAAAVFAVIDCRRLPWRRVGIACIALALGIFAVYAGNYAVAKRLAWTPGGASIAFGRMLQDGIVKKYLDSHCPDAHLRLCAVKDEIPQDADTWFWGSDLFDKMGRFEGLDKEMETIAFNSLVDYPLLQVETAAVATLRQLIDVRTGEGVLSDLWHTRIMIEQHVPALKPPMDASRQMETGIDFDVLNRLHYPVALLAMALLPLLIVMAFRRAIPEELGELATFCTLALLANAFICGVFSNPHDRYGARMVWLAGFTAVMALLYAVEALRRDNVARAKSTAAKPSLSN
jgi:hypothetical protein